MNDASPSSLRTSLEAASWRQLLVIMAFHGLPCSTKWPKVELVNALHHYLLQPGVLNRLLDEADGAIHGALATLLRVGGMNNLASFSALHGESIPARAWRKAPVQQLAIKSPAAWLQAHGLLFLEPAQPRFQSLEQVERSSRRQMGGAQNHSRLVSIPRAG